MMVEADAGFDLRRSSGCPYRDRHDSGPRRRRAPATSRPPGSHRRPAGPDSRKTMSGCISAARSSASPPSCAVTTAKPAWSSSSASARVASTLSSHQQHASQRSRTGRRRRIVGGFVRPPAPAPRHVAASPRTRRHGPGLALHADAPAMQFRPAAVPATGRCPARLWRGRARFVPGRTGRTPARPSADRARCLRRARAPRGRRAQPRRKPDAAPVVTVLRGVAQQVHEHLLEPGRDRRRSRAASRSARWRC